LGPHWQLMAAGACPPHTALAPVKVVGDEDVAYTVAGVPGGGASVGARSCADGSVPDFFSLGEYAAGRPPAPFHCAACAAAVVRHRCMDKLANVLAVTLVAATAAAIGYVW
jgi:hypothetical protein